MRLILASILLGAWVAAAPARGEGGGTVLWDSERLPDLPEPRAFHAAAVLEGMLYASGGLAGDGDAAADRGLLRLDLRDLAPAWEVLEPCPGAGRMRHALVVQYGRSRR